MSVMEKFAEFLQTSPILTIEFDKRYNCFHVRALGNQWEAWGPSLEKAIEKFMKLSEEATPGQ